MDEVLPTFLFRLELWTLLNCQPYDQSWLSALLALLFYAPPVLTLLLFVVGLWHKELYLLLFGFGLTGSSLANSLLNTIVPRAPRIDTCVPMHGAAFSWQVQQVAFFATFALGYASLYQARAQTWPVVLILLFYMLTVAGAHTLNYDFSDAIIAGAAVGSMLALLYQTFLYLVIVPSFPRIMRNSYIRSAGYGDTLCTGVVVPTSLLMMENLERRFPPGQRLLEREAVRAFIAEHED